MCSHYFGQAVKCEQTLVCIVINGRNVSKFSQCGCKFSQCGRDISMRPQSEHRAHTSVRLLCTHFGKFSRYEKKLACNQTTLDNNYSYSSQVKWT